MLNHLEGLVRSAEHLFGLLPRRFRPATGVASAREALGCHFERVPARRRVRLLRALQHQAEFEHPVKSLLGQVGGQIDGGLKV